jgi:putative protease
LHEQNSSANRGACLQTCRKEYIVTEKESGIDFEVDNEYIMSAKDLKTIDFLDKVLETGVSVLKVEGRGRPPEYVFKVVSAYDEAINSVIDGSFGAEKIEKWNEKLSEVFNRGFWGWYLFGRELGEWSEVYGSKATKVKSYIGKGTNYFKNIGVAEFLVESGSISNGDEILISGPSTGVIEMIIENIHVNEKPVNKAIKGEYMSVKIDSVIRRSDKLYKVEKTEFSKK